MDYEKKYKEVKALIEDCIPDEDGYIHVKPSDICPELAESEDEKMRRWIINYLDNKALNSGIIQEKTNIKNAIAWLEKQGEQKSIDDLTQQEAMDIAVAKCFEQGEQRPDKVEPKFKVGDIITDGKNKYEVLSWDYTETGIAAYYMKGAGCKFSWNCEEVDKKLYIVEQKPADVRTTGYWLVEDTEQKPAWSEEDTEMLNMVMQSCEKCGNEYVVYWLKSLKDRIQPQSQWKPSDKQMKLLREVQQALLGKDCHNRFVNFMYELKRLREK